MSDPTDEHSTDGSRLLALLALIALVVTVAVVGLARGGDRDPTGEEPDDPRASPSSSPPPETTSPGDAATRAGADPREQSTKEGAPAASSTPPKPPRVEHVIAISVDGLGTQAIEALGPDRTPTLHELLREGSGTFNARTAFEQNITLPNHAGMITGRRIARSAGGHGVTWNTNRPHDTVQAASGDEGIESIFSVAHDDGLSTALYSSKAKFDVFVDSWPDDIDTVRFDGDDATLVDLVVGRVNDQLPGLTFLHLDAPDATGHEHGGMSSQYLDAVAGTDALVGRLVAALEQSDDGGRHTMVVLTADHGFAPGAHNHTPHLRENFTIPFLVWGPAVGFGDLYALNPEYADPGSGRPDYAGPQPVRNLDLAEIAMRALRLPPLVDDGELALRWRAAVRLPEPSTD